MGYKAEPTHQNIQINGSNFDVFCQLTENELMSDDNDHGLRVLENLKKHCIAIPHNLSIIATINTSDESIYYLDSAFKRRWDWEYIDIPSVIDGVILIPKAIYDIKVVLGNKEFHWHDLVIHLNEFIKKQHQYIRRIEDKQIGLWFLKAKNGIIEESAIKNKLMFYLWDSVFSKDRRPLEKLIGEQLITYGDFATLTNEFILKIVPERCVQNIVPPAPPIVPPAPPIVPPTPPLPTLTRRGRSPAPPQVDPDLLAHNV